MKTRYSKEDIEKLISNPHVLMVKYGSRIEYKENFKKWAVYQSVYHPELSAKQIFEMAGFDISILGKRTPEQRIRYWKYKYLEKESNEIKKLELENHKKINFLALKFQHLLKILNKKDE